MISVLIPVYNFNINNFVEELYSQSVADHIDCEILIMDDASDTRFRQINAGLQNINIVKYVQLERNIGRSKIRNLLAEHASYDYLLFADCDSRISNAHYLKNYVELCKGELVICGGRTYETDKPFCRSKLLRWKYGTKREILSVETRNHAPYRSFMTNNYLISRSIHQKIKFDESLSQYGHEDTLFGIELLKSDIPVIHIDNPLIHIGLESSDAFIEKTEKALFNLHKIDQKYRYPELIENVRILKHAKRYRFMRNILIRTLNLIKRPILNNLKGSSPKLFVFDLYKLAYFYKVIMNENHKK
jgi:glycosyltransferase involved in cell wall biosynthesis